MGIGSWFGWGSGGGVSHITVNGANVGTALMELLYCDDIQPGSEVSYQTCKNIWTFHTFGRKMTEAPVKMAQAQPREITVEGHPDDIIKAFKDEAQALQSDRFILNVKTMSRVYGVSTLILGCVGKPTDKPLDMASIWKEQIYFNALDSLNTAGSLVLSQIPGTPDFQRPITVRTNGQTYHPSRFQVVMNEEPIFIEYTNSAFGYAGRSVFQRALFQMKSFIDTQIANDMIATKLGVFIAKLKQAGSIAAQQMAQIVGLKRNMVKEAKTWNVISVGHEEDVQTLNMQNVDGAGTYARTNIIKDIATAADMPAVLLENETMVEGFGEGTEDAKVIAGYVESIRTELQPLYSFTDSIAQYRAWSPPFFERMKQAYPAIYGNMTFDLAFSEWRRQFKATWPNLLRESPSEAAKLEEVKLESLINMMEVLLPQLDPANKILFLQSSMENLIENKLLFPHGFADLDWDSLLEFFESNQQMAQEQHEAGMQSADENNTGESGKKFTKVDSFKRPSYAKARALLDELSKKRVTKAA